MNRLVLLAVVATAAEIMLWLGWSHIDRDPFPSITVQIAFIGGITLFLVPHGIAWIGRSKPWVLLPAGALGICLTVLSAMSPFLLLGTVPFVLFPSLMYLIAFVASTGKANA